MSHTIAAVSTGLSVSAIGIIRMTGDDCAQIAEKVFTPEFGRPLRDAPDKKLVLGSLMDKQGRVIDKCCAIYSRAPHTYTGRVPCFGRWTTGPPGRSPGIFFLMSVLIQCSWLIAKESACQCKR